MENTVQTEFSGLPAKSHAPATNGGFTVPVRKKEIITLRLTAADE